MLAGGGCRCREAGLVQRLPPSCAKRANNRAAAALSSEVASSSVLYHVTLDHSAFFGHDDDLTYYMVAGEGELGQFISSCRARSGAGDDYYIIVDRRRALLCVAPLLHGR